MILNWNTKNLPHLNASSVMMVITRLSIEKKLPTIENALRASSRISEGEDLLVRAFISYKKPKIVAFETYIVCKNFY